MSKNLLRGCAAILAALVLLTALALPSAHAQQSPADARDVRLDVTVRLAPAIEVGNLMRTDLFDRDLLPLEDPYGSGVAFVRDDFVNKPVIVRPVDWVRVELRDVDSPSTVVGEVSALLLGNGKVVDVDGDPVRVPVDESVTQAHVVVIHKSSLPVASPEVTIADLPVVDRLTYSFTQAHVSPFDSDHEHQTPIDTGLPWQEFAMIGGNMVQESDTGEAFDTYDINGEDIASFSPVNGLWNVYLPQDLNLDGQVDGQDKAIFENSSVNGTFSAIPFAS